MVAMMSFYAEKCCHQVSEVEASAGRLCSSVHQFMIYTTFVLVVNKKQLTTSCAAFR